jgi:hypothetical protein
MASVPQEGTCAVGSILSGALSWLVVVTIGLAPIVGYWLAGVVGQALRRKALGPLAGSPQAEPEEEPGKRPSGVKVALSAHPPTGEPTLC